MPAGAKFHSLHLFGKLVLDKADKRAFVIGLRNETTDRRRAVFAGRSDHDLSLVENRDSLSASQIAPVECLAYVELPNIIQTAKRWPDSDLCQILGEPSVQRFLRQPISKAPANYRSAWSSFAALRCSALFVGMTDPDA